MVPWSRLIRFVAQDGKVYFGEPIRQSPTDKSIEDVGSAESLKARVIAGTNVLGDDCVVTDQVLEVKQLIGPLTPNMVPTVRCIGLNYIKHIQEGGRKPPPKPSLFFKPSGSVAGPNEKIPIPKCCQDDQCDYEGEMTVVIGKACKNVKKEEALDYVLGYTVGNDISSRKWQRDPNLAGGVPQWGFSKGFDKWAPIGPCIVSKEIIKDPGKLDIVTKINGEVRQDSNTSDLLFDVPSIIEFLSQGTTLEPGSIILTGTPSGVGYAMKTPQFLKDGDKVEIYVEKIGTLKHEMKYE